MKIFYNRKILLWMKTQPEAMLESKSPLIKKYQPAIKGAKKFDDVDKQIDEIDKQIIDLLSKDGRMKLVDIGRQLSGKDKQGYSHVGVKNRITKLVNAGILKIQATLNLNKLRMIIGTLQAQSWRCRAASTCT